jgi:signal transduction histidine kinase
LTRLNTELERAKAEADQANVSKTRFVAAASHDILQPLNAARLYVTSLIERQRTGEDADLIQNIDASLEAVEEIFSALLDISRLDTGAMKPEFAEFRIDELLHRLEVEFTPLAREKGLALIFMPCALYVRSDRRLLRRLLQNLISNAIKYTPNGRVLIGCRRRGERMCIEVYDTGIGRAGPLDCRAHRARARLRDRAEIAGRSRLAFFRRGAVRRKRCGRVEASRHAATRCRTARRHGGAVHRQ